MNVNTIIETLHGDSLSILHSTYIEATFWELRRKTSNLIIIDNVEFVFEMTSQADEAISTIAITLKELNWKINESKTEITMSTEILIFGEKHKDMTVRI